MGDITVYIWVAIGGALGSVARYALGNAMTLAVGPDFPWGTLLINVLGSFVISFFGVLTGGTAKLTGIAEAAARVFGVPAHLGEAPTWVSENLRDPGYHTALGLLYYGINAHAEKTAGTRRRSIGQGSAT